MKSEQAVLPNSCLEEEEEEEEVYIFIMQILWEFESENHIFPPYYESGRIF
jgi:hypothetical protein